MKKIWSWLKYILISIGAVLVSLLGYKVAKQILAQVGEVKDSDNFSLIPDNQEIILVSKKENPKEQIEVVLPEGIKSNNVKAVKIISSKKAIVEIIE